MGTEHAQKKLLHGWIPPSRTELRALVFLPQVPLVAEKAMRVKRLQQPSEERWYHHDPNTQGTTCMQHAVRTMDLRGV